MRIAGEERGRPIREVWLQLTRSEAERLREVLEQMIGAEPVTDPEWHAHVAADDGQAEIAIGWDRH